MSLLDAPGAWRRALVFAIGALAILSNTSFAVPINVTPGDAFFVPAGSGPIGGMVEPGTGLPVPFVSATFNGTLISTVYSGDTTPSQFFVDNAQGADSSWTRRSTR